MKRLTLFGIVLLLPMVVSAQGMKSVQQTATNSSELRVEADFVKHFSKQHVNLSLSEGIYSRLSEATEYVSHGGEIDGATADGTTNKFNPYFRRSYTTVGLDYHPIPYFRMGADYTLKVYGNKFKADDGSTNPACKYLRHRVDLYVAGVWSVDQWKFSLRERIDANIRTDSVNTNEKPKVALQLRHKLQATYSLQAQPLKVYANVELFNTLNQPTDYLNTYGVGQYLKDGVTVNPYFGKTFGQYLSCVRAQVGLKWRVDKRNTLDFAYRFQYDQDRDVNITTNKRHIELTNAQGFNHVLIVAYSLDW